jgi:hypothetical protein
MVRDSRVWWPMLSQGCTQVEIPTFHSVIGSMRMFISIQRAKRYLSIASWSLTQCSCRRMLGGRPALHSETPLKPESNRSSACRVTRKNPSSAHVYSIRFAHPRMKPALKNRRAGASRAHGGLSACQKCGHCPWGVINLSPTIPASRNRQICRQRTRYPQVKMYH